MSGSGGSNEFSPPGPIHHIGIVTDDLDTAKVTYERLGFAAGPAEQPEGQGVLVVPFQLGDTWIEILAPTDTESGVARYLESRGPGFHHVAYLVDDIDATLRELASRGVELVDQRAREGLHGWRVAFLHPRSCGGVLTELVERGSTMGS